MKYSHIISCSKNDRISMSQKLLYLFALSYEVPSAHGWYTRGDTFVKIGTLLLSFGLITEHIWVFSTITIGTYLASLRNVF